MNHTTKFTTIPHRKENNITKSIYRTNRLQPIVIFNAPRFVILVAGPVIMKAVRCFLFLPDSLHIRPGEDILPHTPQPP